MVKKGKKSKRKQRKPRRISKREAQQLKAIKYELEGRDLYQEKRNEREKKINDRKKLIKDLRNRPPITITEEHIKFLERHLDWFVLLINNSCKDLLKDLKETYNKKNPVSVGGYYWTTKKHSNRYFIVKNQQLDPNTATILWTVLLDGHLYKCDGRITVKGDPVNYTTKAHAYPVANVFDKLSCIMAVKLSIVSYGTKVARVTAKALHYVKLPLFDMIGQQNIDENFDSFDPRNYLKDDEGLSLKKICAAYINQWIYEGKIKAEKFYNVPGVPRDVKNILDRTFTGYMTRPFESYKQGYLKHVYRSPYRYAIKYKKYKKPRKRKRETKTNGDGGKEPKRKKRKLK